jgi:hypothetical protein
MEQNAQSQLDSCVWDNRAKEVIAEARKMPPGDRRRAALREAGRLRSAAETYRWLATIEGSLRLGRDARSGDDRDDPAPRPAGLNFHDRTD